jgi:hypothetical protein
MRNGLFLMFLLFFLSFQVNAQKKENLKILYVGGSSDWTDAGDSEKKAEAVKQRTSAFEKYLNQYFTQIKVVQAEAYNEGMSAGYDVTIFDGKIKPISPAKSGIPKYGSLGGDYRAKYLSEEFSSPCIMMAEMGASYGEALGLKTDWYCLCLYDDAHSFKREHQIFNGPFPVKLSIEQKPTPEEVYHQKFYQDGKIPDKLPMWRVQNMLTGSMKGKGYRVGMVARPWGFTDSADGEVISSGVCEKGIDAVAIGRHGNYFHWGFSASPTFMTEEAKQVFANVVVYMSALKGKKVIARKFYDRSPTKDYVKALIWVSSKQYYNELNAQNEEQYKQAEINGKAALAKQASGKALNDQEKRDAAFKRPSTRTFENFVKRALGDKFQIYGTDVDKYHKFYADNLPYLYGSAMFDDFIVDEDVKSLGLSNTDIRLLDKAISMLENNNNVEKAQRILDRYTLCTFESPKEWRDWYETNKKRIFFTQSGGWYFMVDTLDPNVQGNDYKAKTVYLASRSIKLEKPDHTKPVSVGAALATMPNGNQMIVVKFSICPGYHIYSNVSEDDPYIPTKLDFTLPEGYKLVGDMGYPLAKFFNKSGTTQYEDEVVFVRPIDGIGTGDIKVKYSYQCCDEQICFPPVNKEIVLKTNLHEISKD